MPLFSYIAVHKEGQHQKGTLDACNQDEAISRIREIGHIAVVEFKSVAWWRFWIKPEGPTRCMSGEENPISKLSSFLLGIIVGIPSGLIGPLVIYFSIGWIIEGIYWGVLGVVFGFLLLFIAWQCLLGKINRKGNAADWAEADKRLLKDKMFVYDLFNDH